MDKLYSPEMRKALVDDIKRILKGPERLTRNTLRELVEKLDTIRSIEELKEFGY